MSRRKGRPVDPTGYVALVTGEHTPIGAAFERSTEDSEFGLPTDYDDPNQYRGTSPPTERHIGLLRET